MGVDCSLYLEKAGRFGLDRAYVFENAYEAYNRVLREWTDSQTALSILEKHGQKEEHQSPYQQHWIAEARRIIREHPEERVMILDENEEAYLNDRIDLLFRKKGA